MTEVLCTISIQSNPKLDAITHVKAINAALKAWGLSQGLYLWSVRLTDNHTANATFETVPPVTQDG